VMAMGVGPVVSTAGKGTGAISRGASGEDDCTADADASAVEAARAPGAGDVATAIGEAAWPADGLPAVTCDGRLGAARVADPFATVALYLPAGCDAGASLTAGLALTAVRCALPTALRSLAWVS